MTVEAISAPGAMSKAWSAINPVVVDRLRNGLLACTIGWLVGVAAWGAFSSPAISLVIPLLWLLTQCRWQAFLLVTAYHLATLRFSPAFAAPLFESLTMGIVVWFGASAVSGLVWAALKVNSNRALVRAGTLFLALLLTLLPPAGLVIAGHQVVALGFLAPGTGWFGITLLFTVYPLALAWLSVWMQRPGHLLQAVSICAGIAAVLWVIGDKVDASDTTRGRMVGDIATVNTLWGHFSHADDPTIERIEKMGKTVRALTSGAEPLKTIIFPESVLGFFEPGSFAVVENSVLRDAKHAGATVVIGASVAPKAGGREDIAIVFRPDGTSSYVKARQNAPIAYWAPWNKDEHYPADWLSNSSAQIAPGVRARFMFCYEEYIPFLHLMAEARDNSNLVVALANRWGTRNALVGIVQGAHTQGMAKLFGKHWLRAENKPAS